VTVDQPTKPNSTVTAPLALSHLTFDLPLTTRITDIPEGATETQVELAPRLSAQTPPVYSFVQSSEPQMPSHSAFLTMPATPAGAFESYRITERVNFGGSKTESHIGRQRDYTRLPTSTMFAANALALVAVAPVSTADPGHPSVSWSTSSGARGDYAKVAAAWREGTALHTYTAYLPPEAASTFVVPDVPAELKSFAPAPASGFTGVSVEYVAEETSSGYADCSLFRPAATKDGLGIVFSGGSNQAP